jgi:hypothetical protein
LITDVVVVNEGVVMLLIMVVVAVFLGGREGGKKRRKEGTKERRHIYGRKKGRKRYEPRHILLFLNTSFLSAFPFLMHLLSVLLSFYSGSARYSAYSVLFLLCPFFGSLSALLFHLSYG